MDSCCNCSVYENLDGESFEKDVFLIKCLNPFLGFISVFWGPFWAKVLIVGLGCCGSFLEFLFRILGVGSFFLFLTPYFA